MATVAHPFVARFGKPDPAEPNGLRFRDAFMERWWTNESRRVGAGWYLRRFLYLFGERVRRLHACLDAWSFLVPPGPERMVVGRNAYGALLVLERHGSGKDRVHVLDPFRVVYWSDPQLDFMGLIGRWLPERLLPGFLDDSLYRLWVRGDDFLDDDTILAPATPLGLGGDLSPKNVREEEIVSYYRSTAPIYAKAMAGSGKRSGGRSSKGGRRKP